MSKVSMKDMLAAMPLSQFSFLLFEKQVSSPDEHGNKITYLIFELENPIPKVTGSTSIYNPDGDDSVNMVVTDVMTVKCNAELIYADEEKDKPEFYFEVKDGKPTGKGSYAGDLFLDVSKKEEVWLTDQKFKSFGQEMRRGGQRERYQRYKR